MLRELHRAAVLADRPGVSVPSIDASRADAMTGAHARTTDAIRRLVADGRAVHVRRDLLVLPDATGLSRVTVPDLVDATAPQPYLITGGRALQARGLTDQHFLIVVVLAPSPVAEFAYRGERARFLITAARRIWGWADEPGPRIARPERALMDAFSHPRYGVSFSQALGALQLAAREQGFLGALASAAARYGSGSACRRVGFVVERLYGPAAAEPFVRLIGSSLAPTPLRPRGPHGGPVDRRWRVVVNADVEAAAERVA